MQTWSLRKPIVQAIPKEHILLLDLNSGSWKGTEAFWGRPWVAGIIHNFGGKTYLGGGLQPSLDLFPNILSKKTEIGDLQGIGMFPEAIEQNPVIYDAASEMTWYTEKVDTKKWLYDYLRARYGKLDDASKQTWDILLQTVYGSKHIEVDMETSISAKPSLNVTRAAPNGTVSSQKNYPFVKLWDAVSLFQNATPAVKNKDTYKFDLVDLMRQCLADLAIPVQKQMANAYLKNQTDSFQVYSKRYLDLINDFDILLGARKEFLFGKWLADARAIGKTEVEKHAYEKSARGLITLWGPANDEAIQFDYSNRAWNGLVGTYYKPRWEKFIAMLNEELKKPAAERFNGKVKSSDGRPANNANEFYKNLAQWESDWVTKPGVVTRTVPTGNEVLAVKKMYDKWKAVAMEIYR
jgi:alpha-N-acetylglucosaminidase